MLKPLCDCPVWPPCRCGLPALPPPTAVIASAFPELEPPVLAAPTADEPGAAHLECVQCGAELSWVGRGRKPLYCSPRCRARAHRAKAEEPALDLVMTTTVGGIG